MRSRVIRGMKPNRKLALISLRHARSDIETAKTLIEHKKYDWSLAISYNAMLVAGRALMFSKGYRPSTTEGHIAVVKLLQATSDIEASERMSMAMNGMRKKRHRVVYEETDTVSEEEARQAIRWGEEFLGRVTEAIC